MAIMAKTFREWNPEQNVMFPPSALDLVPQGQLAHFVRHVVSEQLDLSEIEDSYGYLPQFHQRQVGRIKFIADNCKYQSRQY